MTDLNLPEILDRCQRAVDLVARVTETEATGVAWRVVLSDSESPDAVVPLCANPDHNARAAQQDVPPEVLFDDECCPYYVIDTHHGLVADFVAATFTDVPALVAEVERLRALFGEALDKVDTVAGARFLTDRYRSRLTEGGQGGAP